MAVTLFSPAKLNLFLAITGRRADGFHELLSVAAPLAFGDELEAVRRTDAERATADGSAQFTLECTASDVPCDETNLVLKAARAFARLTGWRDAVHFRLVKRVPIGAGLGGGSSNAVAALRALNQLACAPLAPAQLRALAAELGSDCALFLHDGPVVMRGRGEQVEDVPASAAARMRGQRVVVFKPSFGIATPWAYGRMVARRVDYEAAAEAEAMLAGWLGGTAPLGALLANNMQPAAFEKFVALPVLLGQLREEFGVATMMSGSGSACFALLPDHQAESGILARVRAAWGEHAVVAVTHLA